MEHSTVKYRVLTKTSAQGEEASKMLDIDPQNEMTEAYGSTSVLVAEGPKMNNKLTIFKAVSNTLAHIFIGVIVGTNLIFAFSNGLPVNPTPIHVALCVPGYQFLMAEAILSLLPENSWSATLTLVQKRRIHWILQIIGSALAIAGSCVRILAKETHWNTSHGQFGLVALIFTSASLLNGVTSLYAYELRLKSSGKLSKITHICFGTIAFVAACITLCYGYEKNSFKTWGSPVLSTILTVITAALTFIIAVNPIVNVFGKINRR